MTPQELVARQPIALRVACAKLADALHAGDVGLIFTESDDFAMLEVNAITCEAALDLAEEIGAPRIARRLRCELAPCGSVWVLLVIGAGLHLLALPLEARPNALGGDA